ncbi:helix-turn-helix transcriptional regulator [Algoriphagus sp. C2-6-M1]|uniref:helix-turn-helix domain-containing protein n=1 Tax=Algoriphagus persicinus TaxID=3108754 RepID=UPI002B3D7371|nr:helix-turn-helix transcriptional regulator [Algoriphagus sp. C2-6-M1]MEB2780015.1 helix-turn-helix transcriptional regulator [Algoriphagus sp. C2-6-M1]
MGNLKDLAAKNPSSNWKDKVVFRKENKVWLKSSRKIAWCILDALDDKGWNQKDLAKALSVTPKQVGQMVKGEFDFNLSTISKLERVLAIDL